MRRRAFFIAVPKMKRGRAEQMAAYEAIIQAAFQELLRATTPEGRQLAGMHFTRAIRLRNAERTPQEVAALERKRGLR